MPPTIDTPVRLLLVDDEVSIRVPLAEYLIEAGMCVDAVANAAEARSRVAATRYDLVVTDIMMPGEDGLSLTRWLREVHRLPVILLTARLEETERVIGLEIGADDYIAKPFGPRELVARIRAVLRRAAPRDDAPSEPSEARGEGELYRFGGWTLSTDTRGIVHDDGRTTDLTGGEYGLLLALVQHPRVVMSRDRLLDLVRGREAELFDRAIDNLVSRLRRKVEDHPAAPTLIKTVWGGGYSLAADVRRIGAR